MCIYIDMYINIYIYIIFFLIFERTLRVIHKSFALLFSTTNCVHTSNELWAHGQFVPESTLCVIYWISRATIRPNHVYVIHICVTNCVYTSNELWMYGQSVPESALCVIYIIFRATIRHMRQQPLLAAICVLMCLWYIYIYIYIYGSLLV